MWDKELRQISRRQTTEPRWILIFERQVREVKSAKGYPEVLKTIGEIPWEQVLDVKKAKPEQGNSPLLKDFNWSWTLPMIHTEISRVFSEPQDLTSRAGYTVLFLFCKRGHCSQRIRHLAKVRGLMNGAGPGTLCGAALHHCGFFVPSDNFSGSGNIWGP